MSQGISTVSSVSTGERRPEASGSPKTIFLQTPGGAGASREAALAKKGILCESAKCEGDRCLSCNVVCQTCADVCPNRANVVVKLPDGRAQILHVDRMCNECGNCLVFCPYDSAPYRDKFTLSGQPRLSVSMP